MGEPSLEKVLSVLARQEGLLRYFTDQYAGMHDLLQQQFDVVQGMDAVLQKKVENIFQMTSAVLASRESTEASGSPLIPPDCPPQPSLAINAGLGRTLPDTAMNCSLPDGQIKRRSRIVIADAVPSLLARGGMPDEGHDTVRNLDKEMAELEKRQEEESFELRDRNTMMSVPSSVRFEAPCVAFERFCHFVRSDLFEMIIGIAILLNSFTMALEAQYRGSILAEELGYARSSRPPEWQKTGLDVMNDIMLIVFVFELLAKVVALRTRFITGNNKWWNLSDVFIVGFGVLDRFGLLNIGLDTTMIRLFRLVKLARLLKLFKTLRNSLQTMMLILKSVRASKRTLFWSMLLLFSIQYVTGLFVWQLTSGFLANDAHNKQTRLEIFEYYGTFSRVQLTMFEITHVNYAKAVRILCEGISEWWAWFFIFYRCSVAFAFLAVIRAVFIQSTLKVADTDKDLILHNKKKAAEDLENKVTEIFRLLFGHLANEEDFAIPREEFVSVMCKDSTKIWMSALDIDTSYPEGLFQLLDLDGEGCVSLKECIYAAKKIRGPARAIDLFHLHTQVHRTEAKIDALLPEHLRGNVYPKTDRKSVV